ncbi:YfbK domain-containing protein [Fuscibacter oryzae]|uniref:von Willebrand factor type A domain-containing protein n=1 Tax=Fuscibacter oryzae TaxID=2803939 RepID=A0A8J7MSQ2_9RHOB|nr:von Willebrand factor type A domain-containing protein [Fuscibacter oryzae]MBL4928856.1 von Willebrand factor type A domain-containing protein [Fuscibacter oryzae]
MTDELDDLKAAMQRATPVADDKARARALAQAMENFDRLQGSANGLRSNGNPPVKAGIFAGAFSMLNALKSRPLLTATTSAAALIAGFVVFLPIAGQLPVSGGKPEVAQTSDPAPQVQPAKPKARPSLPPETKTEPALTEDLAAPRNAISAALPEAPPPLEAEGRLRMESDSAIAAAPMAERAVGGAMPYLVDPAPVPVENSEAFSNAPVNPVHVTAEEPVSTFSIDVDTASYAVVRSSLMAGMLPDADSVRVEEMVNYFLYSYPAPEAGQAFRPTVTVMPTPWNAGTRLVHIGIQGAVPAVERPPLNLVFLIDTSGSMEDANKLPLLKQSLALMLPQLHPQDQVAIVAYAGSAGLVLPPTAASDKAAILAALDNLDAGGSTAGAEGIALAYQVAEGMKAKGEVSRVLLATDGDFNVGIDDPADLTKMIEKQRETGTYLSVLGFGRGNLDDATMQALAQNGNGTASYIDTLNEARKVLVDQLTGALYPIADNVKIQVEWNPAAVAEYRLIGYETRALAREDFNNDKVDAGDIGAGTQVTAIYEVTPPGSPALLNDPLRYGAAPATGSTAELGFLRLRSVAPGQTQSTLLETPIPQETAAPSQDAQFAVAIAGFGQKLRGAKYLGDWGWDQMIALATKARGEDAFGYRAEAVNLMRLAESLSAR